MATIINDPNDPNKQNQPNTAQNPPGSPNPAPQGTGTSNPTSSSQAQPVKSAYPTIGGAGAIGAQVPSRNKQQGSGFTNLQRVIGANQNNKLGQAVGGGIQNTQQRYNQNLGQSGQQFQQQAGNARLDTEGNRSYVQNTLGKVTQDPTQVKQEDYDQFGNLRAGNYAGPHDLQNYAELQAQAGDVSSLGDLTRDSGGRQALLQRFVGGNRGYTGGQQNLDTLLLGQTGQNQLNQARVGARNVNPALAQQENAARALAQQYAGENKGFGQNVLGQVTGVRDVELGRLGTVASQAELDKTARIDAIKAKLAAGQSEDIVLSAADAATLGLKGGEELNTGALDAFTASKLKADAENVGTQKDYAAQAALAKLGGYNQNGFMDQSLIGSFYNNQFNFDQLDQAQKAVAEKAQAELDPLKRRSVAAGRAIGGYSGQEYDPYSADLGGEFGSGNVYNTQKKSQFFASQAAEVQKQLDAINAQPKMASLADQLKQAQAAGDQQRAAQIGMQMAFGMQQQGFNMQNLAKIDPNRLQFEDANNSIYTPEPFDLQHQIANSSQQQHHQGNGYDTETAAYNQRMNELYGTQESAAKTYQDILNQYKGQQQRYENETARYKGYQTKADQDAQDLEAKYGYKRSGIGGLQGRKVIIDDEQAKLAALSQMSGGGQTLANRNRQS